MTIKCDYDNCKEKPQYVCCCKRCNSESDEDEKFHCCGKHKVEAGIYHELVRGRKANWLIF